MEFVPVKIFCMQWFANFYSFAWHDILTSIFLLCWINILLFLTELLFLFFKLYHDREAKVDRLLLSRVIHSLVSSATQQCDVRAKKVLQFFTEFFKSSRYIWATSWENLFMPFANNKGADQPAHPRSLISAFVVRCIDSIIPLSSFYTRNFKPLPSFCDCADRFESYLVWNPEDRFSCDEAHIIRICNGC